MVVYIIYIILCIIGICAYDSRISKGHKVGRKLYWLILCFLILILGFRYYMGGDDLKFLHDFEDMDATIGLGEGMVYYFLLYGYMPLWFLLNFIAKISFDSFYVVQIVEAAVVNFTIFYLILKYCKRPFLALLLYFIFFYMFYFSTEIMREALAISCCIWAMDAYLSGSKMRFCICVLTGILFHISAIVFLAIPIVPYIRPRLWLIALAVTASLIVFLLSDTLVSHIPMFGEGSVSNKIESYASRTVTIFGFLFKCINNIIVPGFIFYLSYKLMFKTSDNTKQLEKVFGFFIVIAIFSNGIVGFSRFQNYYIPFLLICFVNMISGYLQVRRPTLNYMLFAILVLYFSWTRFSIYFNEYGKYHRYDLYYPYTCIIDEKNNKSFDYRYVIFKDAQNTSTSENYRK